MAAKVMNLKIYLPALCFNLLVLFPQAISNKQPTVPAIYCFGDSFFDSGNNNYLPTVARANFTPYGIDFVNGPTGRATNNKTIVDSLAKKLGLPFPPPYLGLVGKRKPLTGINYASASCGILDETGKRLGHCLPLRKQIDYFENTIRELERQHPLPLRTLKKYLAESIIVTSIGLNDYFNNYLQPDFYNTSTLTPEQFSQLLVDSFSQQLKRLYRLGARKFVVFEIWAAGCIPLAVTNSTGRCSDDVNQLVSLYNQKLKQRLPQLQTNLPKSKFTLGDSFDLALSIYLNPTQFGFQAETVPCCAVNNMGLCIPGGAVCQDRSTYISFDAIHPTDAVYLIVANSCFDQSPSICSPLTVKQLAQA